MEVFVFLRLRWERGWYREVACDGAMNDYTGFSDVVDENFDCICPSSQPLRKQLAMYERRS